MDNPPAFPNDPRVQLGDDYQGMTLRDWFAGQALTGILANGAGEDDDQGLRLIIARDAFDYADAMLAARAQSIREGVDRD